MLTAPAVAPDNGFQVASLPGLAGTKAAVVQQRAEAKGDLDIDTLLNDRRIDLPAALARARDPWPVIRPQLTLKAQSLFGNGTLHRLPCEMPDRSARAAHEVDQDRPPGIGRRDGTRKS
jgi:hypothetical protein